MEKAVLEAIKYIKMAVNKTEEFDDYSPEMSSRVLDNRIITLEGYMKYIEKEALPKFENLAEKSEVETNG